jgi:hypothetical protein
VIKIEQLSFFSDLEIKQIHASHPQKTKDYQQFVDKFKPKKTTDDCYTPEIVHEAVENWCAKEFNLDKSDFVRPFYPGGDYKHFDYSGGKIVVDNPPFSILSEIIRFYCAYSIRFLLYAPTLSGLVRYSDLCTVYPTGVDIKYENGAVVPTSFCTNLDNQEIRARTVPELYRAVKEANEINIGYKRKKMPKYVYPMNVITSAQMYPLARVGISFVIPRKNSDRISKIDANKQGIFGCGWIVSDAVAAEREKAEREKAEREKAEREKAEREKAEREKAEVFALSDREKAIIKGLE